MWCADWWVMYCSSDLMVLPWQNPLECLVSRRQYTVIVLDTQAKCPFVDGVIRPKRSIGSAILNGAGRRCDIFHLTASRSDVLSIAKRFKEEPNIESICQAESNRDVFTRAGSRTLAWSGSPWFSQSANWFESFQHGIDPIPPPPVVLTSGGSYPGSPGGMQ